MKFKGCSSWVVKNFQVLVSLVIFVFITSSNVHSQLLSNINNPVLPGVADAGVIKYNGEYYIGGVFTNGSFYISNDLVKWEGPAHVFSMDNKWTGGRSAEDSQIHANDINYINGLFHQYWSVNYWGRDRNSIHIGHAVSPNILGPYNEPDKNTWLDNRIDPELFIDDDGKLYMYMVKFTDGNTIWARPMKDPATFSGDPVYLFASLPNTWETLDNRVAEGPWVIKYRDRYYMMYNSNHTSTRWGNYALGVAEASSPLGFNHGNKYSYPVVKSNQIDLEETYVDLLNHAAKVPGTFLYSFNQPLSEHWKNPEFNDTSWKRGRTGFGSDLVKESTTRVVKTIWKTSGIWLRNSFSIQKKNIGSLMLRIHHDGDSKVFLNGTLIYQAEDRNYQTWNFDKKAASLIKDGENVIAVESLPGERSSFLDISLFDLKGQTGDDILYSPGQPNILRGPNGFEWWLVYMANRNNEKRGQFVNRVHFFDKKMEVEDISGIKTSGYHPVPAQPTFSHLFNTDEKWQNKWTIKGDWNVQNKELVQGSGGIAHAFVKSNPATHYLFEAGVKMYHTQTSRAGIFAWWKDEQNWLRVVLDQKNKTWAYILNEEGEQRSNSFPLHPDFNFNVYHTLTVYKNASDFSVRIDNLNAPGSSVIKTSFTGKGIPGLYSEDSNNAFDGVLYTIGWDEFDSTITGWNTPAGKSKKDWEVSEKGISIDGSTGEQAILKGDFIEQYEYSLQVQASDDKGRAGMYPVYIDENNYLKTVIDFKNQKLSISGKKNSKSLKINDFPLESRKSYYADMKNTDFFEKQYVFNSAAFINSIELNRTPHNKPDTVISDIHKKMDVFYKSEGNWTPLSYQESASAHPGFDKISFNPVKAEGLRFINKQAGDTNFYIYKIWVNELAKQSYNLRTVKRKDAIIFFIDGKEVFRMKHNFPASQVGLLAHEAKASFNGITFFHLPN